MRFNNVVIDSFAYEMPPIKITSDEIEKKLTPLYSRLNLPAGRLELMTGIHERGMWPLGTKPSTIASMAARKVFEKTDIKKNEVDLIIHASVCRDFLEPATASVVHAELGLSQDCMIFDLSNACLGVINAIVVAGNMIDNGQIKNALIVSGENGGPLIENTLKELISNNSISRKDIKKYIANLTIGSAATAILLTHKSKNPNAPRILGGAFQTDSSANHLCRGDGNTQELIMETNSEELLKYGIDLAKKTWLKTCEELKWTNQSVQLVLTHQVGVAHEKLSLESVGLQECKTFKTYPTLGNTGSSALPITLMRAVENDLVKKDDHIALLGIGSGLSSIMLGVQW